MLETQSVSGVAKPVLEFAREAAHGDPGGPRIELTAMSFRRSGMASENSLTAAMRRADIPLESVFERRRFDTAVVRQLQDLVARQKPDLIWSNSVKSHFLVRMAGLHRACKWLAFHHGYTTTNLRMRLYNQLDRWSLRCAHRVVTVCRPFARELEKLGVPPDRIRVQHVPVRPMEMATEEQRAHLRRHWGIGEQDRVILTVGRLSREKGHLDLVRAFAEARQAEGSGSLRLLLVGEGPERGRIERLCGDRSLADSVILAGQQEEIAPYYAVADVFVLSSHSEGSPNVLLEAMAAGVPVVATSVGGIPELATDGKDALLVNKGDIAGLSAALVRVLADGGLRQRLSSAACQVVLRNTPEAFFGLIAGVMQEAISA
jgi:glycosyltransferase involved in cell wall biosynthesis